VLIFFFKISLQQMKPRRHSLCCASCIRALCST